MAMRVSFDFIVKGFTIGCSVTGETPFSTLNVLPVASLLPSQQSTFVSLACICLAYVTYRVQRSYRYAGVSYDVPVPEQCGKDWEGEVLENPSIKSADDYMINCYCPANGKLLGKLAPAYPEDIDAAISTSAVAQAAWAKTTFDDRRKVIRTLLKYVLMHQDEIVTAACLDSGKTKIDGALGEILVTVEKMKWILKHGEDALKPSNRAVSWPLMGYKKAEVRYEPLGVICACVSWNYPFHNLLGPILSSIFAGNGIIVKGSENTAWSSRYFVSIVKRALAVCGHSPGLVESIMCWPEVAPHLTSHPGISHVTFIGSRPVAHHVAASASKVLTPLCIELGGKDAVIVLDDVSNLQALSSILMRGVFQSCGQNCVGIERIIALPTVYPEIVSILESRIKTLRLGSVLDDDPHSVDCGAMISDTGFGRLESLIAAAVKQGARCLVGGKRYQHLKHPKGHYFMPTLLVDVTRDMAIAQNEVFAPICTVMRATSITDAVAVANSTEYALGGSVFGRDKASLDRVTREMKCGMVSVNDFAVYYLNQSLPFGGVKGSGYGRFAGEEGLRSVCNLKAVCEDRFPRFLGTAIPSVVDYPIQDGERGWRFTKGLVELGYGQSLMQKIGGLWKLIL